MVTAMSEQAQDEFGFEPGSVSIIPMIDLFEDGAYGNGWEAGAMRWTPGDPVYNADTD